MNRTLLAEILLSISILVYAGFWVWAMVHAILTPKARPNQRIFWAGAMFVNPSTAIWYWYIWKRWAFWTLFTPIFGAFISLPFIVRSLLSKAEATNVTNALFALGTRPVVIFVAALLVYPLILRLVALLHLGRNIHLSAMDRNDWVIAFAIPVFGFGASLAYCANHRRAWAIASLGWFALISIGSTLLIRNVIHEIIPAGEERRELFRSTQRPT